jgi:RNA polymerase sigma-70 factor (ECF subfamily)
VRAIGRGAVGLRRAGHWRNIANMPADEPDAIRAQFEALMRAHYAGLCSFVARMTRSRAAAEDIVQTLFTNLWERRAAFTYDRPEAYLYRAARNRAINHLRRERVRAAWEARVKLTAITAVEELPESSDVAELQAAIDGAIAALPARCRLIFTMNREQGLRYHEIAQVLGISIKTVETQMGRALKSLRFRLADFLSGGTLVLAATELRARLFG